MRKALGSVRKGAKGIPPKSAKQKSANGPLTGIWKRNIMH